MEHFLFHILLLTYWFPTDRKSNESLSPIFFTILDTHSVIWELSEPLGRPSNLVIVSEWINIFCFLLFSSWSIFPGRDDRFWYNTNTWRPSDCQSQSCQHRIQASSHFSKTASLLYWFSANISKHLFFWIKTCNIL